MLCAPVTLNLLSRHRQSLSFNMAAFVHNEMTSYGQFESLRHGLECIAKNLQSLPVIVSHYSGVPAFIFAISVRSSAHRSPPSVIYRAVNRAMNSGKSSDATTSLVLAKIT